MDLFFAAMEVKNNTQKRVSILLNMSEDSFRIAESVEIGGDSEEDYNTYIRKLVTLFERNQNPVGRRFNFTKRLQLPGETVDNFALALRELSSKCSFTADEVNGRLNDQFMAGVSDKALQCKLLQEPTDSLAESLVVARRFEAARSAQVIIAEDRDRSKPKQDFRTISSSKVCFECHGFGHLAKQCPFYSRGNVTKQQKYSNTYICYNCGRKGHVARFSRFSNETNNPENQEEQRTGTVERNKRQRLCFVCDKPGHVAKDCPVKKRLLAEKSGVQASKPPGPSREATLSTITPASSKDALIIDVKIEDQIRHCLIDTGSPINLISQEVFTTMSADKVIEPNDLVAHAANGKPLGIIGKVRLDISMNDKTSNLPFYIVEGIRPGILLGLTWLIENESLLDLKEQKLCFPDDTFVPVLRRYSEEK